MLKLVHTALHCPELWFSWKLGWPETNWQTITKHLSDHYNDNFLPRRQDTWWSTYIQSRLPKTRKLLELPCKAIESNVWRTWEEAASHFPLRRPCCHLQLSELTICIASIESQTHGYLWTFPLGSPDPDESFPTWAAQWGKCSFRFSVRAVSSITNWTPQRRSI